MNLTERWIIVGDELSWDEFWGLNCPGIIFRPLFDILPYYFERSLPVLTEFDASTKIDHFSTPFPPKSTTFDSISTKIDYFSTKKSPLLIISLTKVDYFSNKIYHFPTKIEHFFFTKLHFLNKNWTFLYQFYHFSTFLSINFFFFITKIDYFFITFSPKLDVFNKNWALWNQIDHLVTKIYNFLGNIF